MDQNTSTLPLVGAALRIAQLPEFAEWIIGEQRDLEIQDPTDPRIFYEDWRELARRGRDLLKGYTGRLGIHGAFGMYTIAASEKMFQDPVVARLMQSLEFAAELGATHMVVHSPFFYFGSPALEYTPRYRRQWLIDASISTLEKVLDYARQINCVLVLENVFDVTYVPLLDMIRTMATEQVRLSIDVGHAVIHQRVGGPTPDQWIYEGSDLLAHVHLQDTDGFIDRHWRIGQGNVKWHGVFAALRSLKQQPRLLLELYDKNDILPSAQWLAENHFAR